MAALIIMEENLQRAIDREELQFIMHELRIFARHVYFYGFLSA